MALQTEIVRIDAANPDTPEAITILERAGRVLHSGGLVAFPTETVYGLGGDAFDPAASARIYAAKGRPSDNPLIVHIADLKDLERVAQSVPEQALTLARHFWPGPLTMILRKRPEVPDATTGGLPTVAVRFPSHPVAQALIRAGGGFIAAPSANRSGRPSPTRASHCIEDLTGRVDMIIDGGEVGIGVESSIVDLTEEIPMLLRPGYVSLDMLRELLGAVEEDPALKQGRTETQPDAADDQAGGLHPKAPGMKYRHYAPRGSMTMVRGDAAAVSARINSLAEASLAEHKRTAVIAATEHMPLYREGLTVYSPGHREDAEEISRNLFDVLRQCDADGMEVIYTEAFDGEGLFQAVMNRLEKACGHRIINT